MVRGECSPPDRRLQRDESKCRSGIVGGGRLQMHRWRTRRPGYPLAGCSPAEPASVSPGDRDVPEEGPASKSNRPTTARVAVMTTGPGVAKDRSFFVRTM